MSRTIERPGVELLRGSTDTRRFQGALRGGKNMRSDRMITTLAAFVTCLTVWQGASAQTSTETYVYNMVDVPGASSTQLLGINDNGELLAYDFTTSSDMLYQNGTFAPLPAPPAGETILASGLNNRGQVVGAITSSGESFVLTGSTYTSFTIPGSVGSQANSISNAGLVTGEYAATQTSPQLGYVYNPATATFSSVGYPGSSMTQAWGVDATGAVTGSYVTASGANAGFLLQNGTYTSFQIAGAHNTNPLAINDTGLITGFADNSGFVGTPASGFQALNVPGALETIGRAINSSGQIAGLYATASGGESGFIATPAWLPSGSTATGAFAFNVAVTANTLMYIDPSTVGNFQYQTGAGNPNFTSVVLPIGIGNDIYSLALCNGTSLGTVTGGETYAFASGGVSCFDVSGIAASSGSGEALATGLTFAASGTFTGTMDPLTQTSSAVPEPSTLALWALGVLGMALVRLGRRGARVP
jgi:hypothetical protein